MTDARLINPPVKTNGPFNPDQITDRDKFRELLEKFPVLNHFVWSSDEKNTIEGSIVRTALLLAEYAGGYNTDTNLALRKLLEVRSLYRLTHDRLLIDMPASKR